MIGNMPTLQWRNNKFSHGFTLIEALVATTVFVIAMSVVVSLIISFIKGPLIQIQRKQLEEQLGYALTEVTKQVRESQLDYSKITSSTNHPTSTLNLINKAGQTVVVNESDDQVKITINNTPAPLTSTAIKIDQLDFFIYPKTNPTVIDPSNPASVVNNQPAVVMVIKAHHADHPETVLQLQTLITTRYYAR